MDAPTKPSPLDVLYFGVWNDEDGPAHVFRCNQHALIIQTRSFFGDLPSRRMEYQSNTAFDVEIIQTMLGGIAWGRSNYAYLVRESSGSYRLMYRNKIPRTITCHLWAPQVDEREIEITRWLDPKMYREGIWRGQEVSLTIMDSCEPRAAKQIGDEINGARILTSLGYSFEVLGIIMRNGVVAGIMTELMAGRVVEYSDREVVYDAIANLQKHNHIYRGICNIGVLMTDKGVRFVQPAALLTLPEDQVGQLESSAEYWHWDRLKKLFDELKQGRNPMIHPRLINPYCMVIPRLPSLFRELVLDPQIISIASMEYRFKKHLDPSRYSQRQWKVALQIAMKEARSKLATDSWETETISQYPESESSCTSFESSDGVDSPIDKPRSVARSISRLRISSETAFHPYYRTKTRTIRRVLGPDPSRD
ncbi:hypothetical protein NEOLEDRAFT_1139643 [Neolentinus lepideus HHB14362 ss-1]|uniref:Uncharacterized protein n=1 Tax=Neolentinus lepideus HHB14362 ss-1 TaxID=1314782 RepID=A0A165PP20_9AGAM|nr:hypothetical protein NEOLEDRAFT_1139643 [Neolentinus lepideus HHB14362 ss-1]